MVIDVGRSASARRTARFGSRTRDHGASHSSDRPPKIQKAARQPYVRHQNAAREQMPTAGPMMIAECHDAVRRAQALHRHHRRQQLRDAGESGALADAEQQAQRRAASGKVCANPKPMVAVAHIARPDAEHAMRAVALREPAHRNLRQRIGPEERREQQPELRLVQVQIVLDQVRGRRQRAAIHVVDEQHRRQQEHHDRRHARVGSGARSRRGGLGGAESGRIIR